jgi:glyoxylase-like metal-dependent hydrolase (beta-lactamase superfamily II)
MPPVNILNVGYDSTNYYLIGTPAPKLLVDIGWPNTLPKFAHVLKRYNLQFKDIPYALATHYHPDHAGLAQDLKQQGVKLIVMENQHEALASFGKLMKPENNYLPITPKNNIELRFSESRKFLAGLGLAGEIIATPGHSDDSVTLVLDEGFAFTGDLHPMTFALEGQHEIIDASWEKIRALGGRTVYPGHGPVQKIRE